MKVLVTRILELNVEGGNTRRVYSRTAAQDVRLVEWRRKLARSIVAIGN
jgi:hypothetical protein